MQVARDLQALAHHSGITRRSPQSFDFARSRGHALIQFGIQGLQGAAFALPYSGASWVWSYAFLILSFLPVILGLNRIPYQIPVYRLIWRDWYRRFDGQP